MSEIVTKADPKAGDSCLGIGIEFGFKYFNNFLKGFLK